MDTFNSNAEFTEEFHRLGNNLGALIKAVCQSDVRRQSWHKAERRFIKATQAFEDLMEWTHADETAQKARVYIHSVWQTAHGPLLLHEMHLGLVDSLKKLNDRVSECVEDKPAHEITVDDSKPGSIKQNI